MTDMGWVSHLTLEGGWYRCIDPAHCDFLFHLPDTDPVTLQLTPSELLLPLLNAIQPANGQQVSRLTGVQLWEDGEKRIHRDYDLPAVVFPDGGMQWYRHGMRHRVGGPAIIETDGSMHWFQENRRHREGGPAIVRADGKREWWREGRHYRQRPGNRS